MKDNKQPQYRYELWDITDDRLIESFSEAQEARKYCYYCNQKSWREKIRHSYKVLDKITGRWC